MQSNIISDNSRGVEHAFEILYNDKNYRHNNRVCPVAPLKSGDENCWHPANDYSDIGDHRQDDHHGADHWRKVQTENCESNPDENAIHQADQQLASKVRRDVTIDFRQRLRDFVSKGRFAQRQVIFPSVLNARLLVE